MSLLIVGSCSRVTSNIILSLARKNLYQSITIADLLPLYDHHQRYYKLRRQLNDQKSNIPVSLEKLINIETLHKQIASHRDVLHVTHDYFTSVTSKKKLMEITATLSKNVLQGSGRKETFFMQPPSSTITSGKKTHNNTSWTRRKKYSKSTPMQDSSGAMYKTAPKHMRISIKVKTFGKISCFRLQIPLSPELLVRMSLQSRWYNSWRRVAREPISWSGDRRKDTTLK